MKNNFFALLETQWRWVWFSHLFTSLNNLSEKKDKKYRNKINWSFVNSKTSIDKLLESNNINHSILKYIDPSMPSNQSSTNCANSDERARNLHTKRFSRAGNYVHANQSKHL